MAEPDLIEQREAQRREQVGALISSLVAPLDRFAVLVEELEDRTRARVVSRSELLARLRQEEQEAPEAARPDWTSMRANFQAATGIPVVVISATHVRLEIAS